MSTRLSRLSVGLAVTALAVTACSSLPVLEVEGGGPQSEVVAQSEVDFDDDLLALSDEQVARIVEEVQAVLDTSDEDKSSEGLDARLIDPALSMRVAQIVRADKTKTELAPLIIGDAIHSATAGTAFPRVLVVASEATTDTASEVFFLTQEDAKADYMLENWVRLTGGTSVRGLAVQTGSKVLPDTTSETEFTPKDVIQTYVNYLNSPDNEEYQIFEDNVFSSRYREELKAVSEEVEVAGSVSAEATVSSAPVTSVLLEGGDALMAASFTYTQTYKKTVEGSTLKLGGTLAAYLEDPEVTDSATAKSQVNIFFLVPAAGSEEPVHVVGAERTIVSVTKS